MAVNIISLNTRGLRETTKRRAVFNFYRTRCDILCLQETHSTQDVEKLWASEWGGVALFSHGTSNSRGVALLIKKNYHINVIDTRICNSGRKIQCKLEKKWFLFLFVSNLRAEYGLSWVLRKCSQNNYGNER